MSKTLKDSLSDLKNTWISIKQEIVTNENFLSRISYDAKLKNLFLAEKHIISYVLRTYFSSIKDDEDTAKVKSLKTFLSDLRTLEEARKKRTIRVLDDDLKAIFASMDIVNIKRRGIVAGIFPFLFHAAKKLAPVPIVASPLFAALSDSNNLQENVLNTWKDKQRKCSMFSDVTFGVVVHDLKTNAILVDINSNKTFPSASIAKFQAAVAFFHYALQHNKLLADLTNKKLKNIFVASNNADARWLFEQAQGPKNINFMLHNYYPNLFSENTQIVDTIDAYGRPVKNFTTLNDLNKLCVALWNNELPRFDLLKKHMILFDKNNNVMQAMGNDGIIIKKNSRLFSSLVMNEKYTQVYSKTGTDRFVAAETGIVCATTTNGEVIPYAVSFFIKNTHGYQGRPMFDTWKESCNLALKEISAVIFLYMKQKYDLIGKTNDFAYK